VRRTLAIAAAGALVVGACRASGAAPASAAAHRATATVTPASGHRIAGFSLDRDWLAVAEDPTGNDACPIVVLLRAPAGAPRALTRPDGATCKLGGAFWVRPGGRAVGNAIVKALWVVRNGAQAIAVKASTTEPEVVLARAKGITARGPFLGPVVAKNWLRLFGSYTIAADGTESGGVISGNRRELWSDTGTVPALGLDTLEHVVSVGADGSIAMWHAHGARYGRVPDAHARAAALDAAKVYVLRDDAPRLDVRLLSGKLVRSWPVSTDAEPLLDVSGNDAVYLADGAVHELRLDTGRDRVIARAPAGSRLIDAQIESHFVAYAYRGGPDPAGRLVLVRR
jgi:hypothetical protein